MDDSQLEEVKDRLDPEQQSTSTNDTTGPAKYRTWGAGDENYELFPDDINRYQSAGTNFSKYATEDNLGLHREFEDDLLGPFSALGLEGGASYNDDMFGMASQKHPPGFQSPHAAGGRSVGFHSTGDRSQGNGTKYKFQTIESFQTPGLRNNLDIQLPLPYHRQQQQQPQDFANYYNSIPKSLWKQNRTSKVGGSNPTDSAVIFSVQTFKCDLSRSILVYHVPNQLKTVDLWTLFSTYGDIEYIYSGRKEDLGVIVVSYFDLQDAKRAIEKLSSAAFPVEVQFCISVVPPPDLNQESNHCASSEIEDVLRQGEMYFDEHRLIIVNASSVKEVMQFCSRYGTIGSYDQIAEGVIIQFNNIRHCARCFEGMANLSPANRIKAIPIPLDKTKLRLGQSLHAFVKGSSRISGEAAARAAKSMLDPKRNNLDPAAATFVPHHQPHLEKQRSYGGRKHSFSSHETDRSRGSNGMYSHEYGRSHRRVIPTGSHPHHQTLQKMHGHQHHKQGQKLEFLVNMDNVLHGIDRRTSVMIRNIPNKYTQKMFLEELDVYLKGRYDFFYLPIDFKNKCNVGYAFLNVTEFMTVAEVYKHFNNRVWNRFNSDKVCVVSYAKIQGKANLINRFRNSSLMQREVECRPLIFHSDGPRAGLPEQFPMCSGR